MSFVQPAPWQAYHSAQGVRDPKRPSSLIMLRRPGMVAVAWILTSQVPAVGSQAGFVFSTNQALFSTGWQRKPLAPKQLLGLATCPEAVQW